MKDRNILESFYKDTKDHTLDIQNDDGVFRHLVFSNNGSSVYRFNITTWPGFLCVSGDVGCFVFCRNNDMLKFFRSENSELLINPFYWHEKLQSEDCNSKGAEEFSEDIFRTILSNNFSDLCKDNDLDEKQIEELWDAIDHEILSNDSEAMHSFIENHAHLVSFPVES